MSENAELRAGTDAPIADALILDLWQVGRGDLAAAGGKGANLGELLRAGFPVPPGFVVTTAAYDRLVTANQLDEVIRRELREAASSGAKIREAFAGAPIPMEVEREILSAYDRLGQEAVAVRSSATTEDLPGAAFAGQQDTYLNVVGESALLEAVRRCWASLWTDRAISYRERQQIDQAAAKLAVVVQRMVPAEVAGVLFTANPVTGLRDEVVVDASPGLGEAVVSGLVTPDHYVLHQRRWGWSIAERRLGKREVVVRPLAEGGTEHVSPIAATSPQPTLSDWALRHLARLGKAIERHFGSPQDVEWTWADGRFAIVQARPMTALPAAYAPPGPQERLQAGIVAELLPTRPYPLEASTWAAALFGFLPQFLGAFGLKVQPFEQAFVEEDGVVVRLSEEHSIRPTPRILLAPLKLLWLARRYDPARWQDDPLLTGTLSRVRSLEARDLHALSWDELLGTVRETLAIPPLVWELRVRYLPQAALAFGLLWLLLRLLGRGGAFGTLAFTGAETKTLETNRALERLAARIRSDPALAPAFADRPPDELWVALEQQPAGRALLAELRDFLDAYGHREGGGTMQISQPTWKDSPEVVLGILKALAQAEPRESNGRPTWEAVRDDVVVHSLLLLPPARSQFGRLLTLARYFPQLREDTRFYVTMILPVLRRTLLELGERLASVGVLDHAEDVFHLKLEELKRIGGTWPPSAQVADRLRALVARRKERRASLEGVPLVDPRLFRSAEPAGEALLRGTPGSPGVAEGAVRIVRDPSEFGALQPGEVLVAPYTNPAWTPLFQRAVAVVVDSGGAGSHAAIVAREYGIPAVMGTGDGTRRLVDGQRVRVDGGQGVVTHAAERSLTTSG